MSFDIFGPASKDAIRVGYISTERGFVDGVSVCEANEYAKLNPGTQFVFRTRNFTKYLNINEVNELTPDDISPTGSTCEGVNFESECGPPQVYFYGGGGVGVQGNPVIGEDGALLAIDLVEGGYGYQYEPIVEVKDRCNIGVGAVTRAVLGEIVETVEYYDQEGDFEEYELCEPTDVGYGLRYDPSGNPIGPWEPSLYANLSKDPIALEIKEYQDFLRELQNPWWSTRKEPPLKLTSANKVTRTKFNVDYPAWNEFMNSFAISPVPKLNVPGSDFAGIPFTFEWEEDFPYDGEYIFRGLCDNKAELYLDNIKLDDLRSFKDSPNKIQKTIKAGVHRIRLDLLNVPIKERVIRQTITQPSTPNQKPFKVTAAYTGVKNLVNNFKAGIYKVKVAYRQDTGPSGIAIEIKNKSNGKVVFDSLRNINGSNVKLIPVTSGEYALNEFSKNSAESQIFLQRSGVLPENVKDNTTTNIEWTNVYINEDGDYEISASADDQMVLEVLIASALPLNVVPQPPKTSTSSQNIQSRNIFNTIDYINKADRSLWRTFPSVGRDGDFIHQYGITPFDPNTAEANTNSYAGTHVIRWESIDFPVDGNYNIEVMVDDNVTLYIGNRIGGGKVAIGNGLNSVEQGGDEVIITKRGFSGPGRSTGKTTETRFFKAGKYRIRAELEQIPGKPLAQGNPMALAVNIQTSFTEEEVISAKSWNENPMGVALTIDAPMPPIPQEPIPQQEGRCPNNPIWTTRFPNGKEKWWPVKYVNPPGKGPSWSKFTNRYAISPVPPLSSKGSDRGGVVYRNSWDLDIPYDGFYALKSTVDNAGRILIDDVPIMQANYIPTELRNTRGGSGALRRSGISAIDGDGIIYNWREENPKARKIFLSKGKHTIQVEVENGITETFELVDKKIFSTRDWLVNDKGPKTVDVDFEVFVGGQIGKAIRIEELDIVVKKSFDQTPYPKERFKRTIEYGKEYTVKITDFDYKYYNPPGKIQLKSSGSLLQLEDWIENRFDDCYLNASIGKFFDIKGDTCKFVVTYKPPATTSGASKNGALYEGPTPIANYRGDFISPLFDDVNVIPNEEVQGNTWIFRWTNVDFPEDGQYTLEAEADDNLIVRVDGVEVGKSKVFEGRRKTNFNITKGKRTVELELSNIRIPDTGFQQNPVVGFAQITKKINQATGISKPWTENPMGISAILIPPPCPRRIRGKGVVTDVIVDDPGNGFPRPGTGGYPVSLRLKNVVVEDIGINYSCGIDQIQITPSNGAVLDYECDTFGRIINVKVLNPGLGFTRYPEITLPSDTGINATFRPQFEVVRDPIVTEPQKLIQVTDLVGLKQTGYVDGRSYYGAVFYKDGVRYAGFYETPGDLVQVYDTLQESINAQIITPPSAIQRQGTDVTSNNPRLNIPGTPENLI